MKIDRFIGILSILFDISVKWRIIDEFGVDSLKSLHPWSIGKILQSFLKKCRKNMKGDRQLSPFIWYSYSIVNQYQIIRKLR